MFIKSEQGQSLVEVIVAILIVGLIAVGIIKISTTSLKSSRFSVDQTQATAVAEGKISDLKNLKNVDPDLFWDNLVDQPATFEYLENKALCYRKEVVSASLPTTTPNYSTARMAEIRVNIFWDKIGSNSDCSSVSEGKNNYQHSLEFNTFVTN